MRVRNGPVVQRIFYLTRKDNIMMLGMAIIIAFLCVPAGIIAASIVIVAAKDVCDQWRRTYIRLITVLLFFVFTQKISQRMEFYFSEAPVLICFYLLFIFSYTVRLGQAK